jgi:hypothetical protein
MVSRDLGNPDAHSPAISTVLTLDRLRRMADEISTLRSAGPRSVELETWQANVKILLSDYFGNTSEQYRFFEGIWFTLTCPRKARPEIIEDLEYRRKTMQRRSIDEDGAVYGGTDHRRGEAA